MVNYSDCKARIHWFPLWVKSHLFPRWLWRVLIAALGSGSAAQLASPQGCNHLRHHLLITEGCLDYHTMFNGEPPYYEYHNPQHKWRSHSVSLHRALPCWFSDPRNPPSLPPCGLHDRSVQYNLSREIWQKWENTSRKHVIWYGGSSSSSTGFLQS